MAAGLLTAGNLKAADTEISRKAKQFIQETAQGNQAELALAELAQQKAQNSEVKQLAQHIQKDHQQVGQKLQTIAQAHGIVPDKELSFFQKRAQGKLEKLTGAEFDKEYSRLMLEEHVKEINRFEKAAKEIQETDVKQFAQEIAPKLRQHLEHAETAGKASGLDEKTISSIKKDLDTAAGGTVDTPEGAAGGSKRQ